MFWWPEGPKPNSALVKFTEGKSDANLKGNILIEKFPCNEEERIVDGNLEDDLHVLKPYLQWFPGSSEGEEGVVAFDESSPCPTQ